MKSKFQIPKKILSVLLCTLVVFSCVPMSVISVSAIDELTVTIDTGAEVTLKDNDADDYYDIGTADELYAFAYAINGGNTSINAELIADIVVNEGVMTAETDSTAVRHWTSMGNYDNQYTGTFNGNNHTVSGLYINNTETDYVGLFGFIGENGAVENTDVINSYFNGNYYVGGVAGINIGTITNCDNTGEVSGFVAVGGVVGYNNNGGIITNCYNTGYVNGDSYVGGVVGYSYGTITNSYNTGEVSGSSDVGGVVGYNYIGTITNCYYLNTAYNGGINGEDVKGSAEAKSVDQFASGEVAYLLQGEQTENIWGQKLGIDELPALGGEKVYYGYITCDETDNTIGYTNIVTSEETKFDHNFVNGFCSVCKGYEPATLNADGYYEIDNAGKLYWFAEYVNAGNTSANAILTADIVVNEGKMTAETDSTVVRHWTPIGNYDNQYTGTFNGNDHTVSGMYLDNSEVSYVGLFGCIDENGVVKNTGVINSYLNVNDYVGGVVGYNYGTITNCYNTGEVSGSYAVGGVVGYNYGTITNCYNTGEVSGNAAVGGVVGYNYGTITNSYNTGEVSGYDDVGGVVGSNGGTITNCYNTGEVYGSEWYVGGVVGSNSGIITNCYNTGDVRGSVDVGGVVGYNYYGGTLTNCYNIGKVSGNEHVGGVVGVNYLGTITNCYNTGEVSGSSDVGGVVAYNDGTLTNCYYLDTTCTGGINGADVKGSAEAKTDDQFASGEVAYLLQGEQTENIWGQKLGTDELPALGGDKVYYAYKDCNATEKTFCNNGYDEIPTHNYENGSCTICGEENPDAEAISIFGDIDLTLEETDTNIFTGVIDLQAGTYSFNVDDNGTTRGFNYTYTDTAVIDYSAGYKAATTFIANGGRYTFTYNATTKKLTIKFKSFDDIVELVGDINAELVRPNKNTTVFTGTIRLEAGTYSFNVNEHGEIFGIGYSFSDSIYNIPFSYKAAATFVATGGIYSVRYDSSNNQLKILKAPEGLGDVSIFGDISLPLAAQGNGVYSAQTILDAGSYDIRVDSFGTFFGNGTEFTNTVNVEFKSEWKAAATLKVTEKMKFTFIFDTNTNKVKVFNTPIDTTKVKVAFDDIDALILTSADGVNYTGTVSLDAGTYTFRMDEFGTPMGGKYTFTDNGNNMVYNATYASATTMTATGGTYTFSYNVNTDTLKVTKA